MPENTNSKILIRIKKAIGFLEVDSRFTDMDFGSILLSHRNTDSKICVEAVVNVFFLTEHGRASAILSISIDSASDILNISTDFKLDNGSALVFNKAQFESILIEELSFIFEGKVFL